ncbi:hypothetical protein [Variovorax sp. dw_308]|uniref:hypothetical protein n=1 Tax=Variovorax sp. dw_308 TaxID=2721546 RepID=UPI001C45B084|nr:hypothetical protein [Variovorax sp. dw_308]
MATITRRTHLLCIRAAAFIIGKCAARQHGFAETRKPGELTRSLVTGLDGEFKTHAIFSLDRKLNGSGFAGSKRLPPGGASNVEPGEIPLFSAFGVTPDGSGIFTLSGGMVFSNRCCNHLQ